MSSPNTSLISLNIWGGHIKDPLLNFISSHQNIDIFAFQEVYHNAPHKISSDDRQVHLNILSQIHDLLPDHSPFFSPIVNNSYGIALFIKKTIPILSHGDHLIHENPNYPGHGPTHSRNLQFIHCLINNKPLSIINLHGLWNGQGKTDSPERILQSQRIKNFLNSISSPKILCGDFNLRPDTQSLKIIEDGLVNHISLNNIQSTRTSFYTKPELFADYIFSSPDISTSKFEVLPYEVSDHAPLFINFLHS